MSAFPTKGVLKSTVAVATVFVLAGCAVVDIDKAVQETNQTTGAYTQGKLELSRTDQQAQARQKLSDELLAKPLDMNDAVQLALSNSPAVQSLLAESWSSLAQATQVGRISNPIFTFERLRFGEELEIGRLLSVGLIDLMTLPYRQGISRSLVTQAKFQLSASVVEHVTQVRQGWVRAVAAGQVLQYAEQVNASAQASAELAQRMQQVGNFTKLQRQRQQVFYADSAAQLAAARHAHTASREELTRLLGLTDAQSEKLQLPERLPDLPDQAQDARAVSATAAGQRLDVLLARSQLDISGKAQGLNLLTSVVDVELGIRRNTVFDNAAGTSSAKNGFELGIRLPIFDWGSAQRATMNARSLAAASRYEGTVRNASSQLRQSYSAYRTAYDVAKHYRDEIVPLRRAMAEENQLRYNGMLISVFELLADNRDQVSSVMAAINAYQQFWLSDAALAASMTGKPTSMALAAPTASPGPGSSTGAAGH